MPIEISWSVIFKIVIGGLFTYAVFPLVLVGRDLLLLQVIEKWIINSKLNLMVRTCEIDRWFLNNKYNIKMTVFLQGTTKIYRLNNEIVSQDEFEDYEKDRDFHKNRFNLLDAKIKLRSNIVLWFTKHYKLEGVENPISGMRTRHYEIIEKEQNEKA